MEVSPEIQAYIDEQVAGLKAKNEELIAKNKKLSKNAEIDPDEFRQLSEENEALRSKVQEVTKLATTASKDAEKFKGLYDAESGYTAKSMIESGLRAELSKAGVTDNDMLDVLLSKFAQGAKVEAEGDNRVVKLGDKSLSDSIAEWKATPAAAKFIAAPNNQGGGAQGGSGSAAKKTISSSEFSAKTAKEQAAFIAANSEVQIID